MMVKSSTLENERLRIKKLTNTGKILAKKMGLPDTARSYDSPDIGSFMLKDLGDEELRELIK